jgi:hypothetical protein
MKIEASSEDERTSPSYVFLIIGQDQGATFCDLPAFHNPSNKVGNPTMSMHFHGACTHIGGIILFA